MNNKATTLFLLLLLPICIIAYLPWINCPYPSEDLSQTIYQAKKLALGFTPHKDIYSHHILGYLIPFALLDYLIGLTPFTIRILTIISQYFFGLATFFAVRTIFSRSTALLTAFFSVSIGWFLTWAGSTYNLQSYFLPLYMIFLTYIFKCLRSGFVKDLFIGSFIWGLLIILDQRLLLTGPILLIPFLTNQNFRSLKNFSIVIFLSLLPLSLFCTWITLKGGSNDLFEQTILFPFMYRNSGGPSNFTFFNRLISYAGSSQPLLCLLALFGLIICFVKERISGICAVILTTFISGLAYIFISGRDYPHYLIIFSPFIMLTLAYLISELENLSLFKKFSSSFILSFFCFTYVIFSCVPFLIDKDKPYNPNVKIKDEISQTIKSHSTTHDEILVWGGYGISIYLLGERFTSFRDVSLNTISGSNIYSKRKEDQGIVFSMENEFKEYLNKTPPKLIIDYLPTANCYQAGCLDCTPETDYMDLETVQHFEYIKNIISSKYQKIADLNSRYDRAKIYLLIR